MSAYVIVYLENVSDPAALDEYRRLGVPTLKEAGAKVLIRNGRFETPEGPVPKGVVMLEFPTLEAAQAWYHSPKYQAALQHRLRGATCRVVMAEGV